MSHATSVWADGTRASHLLLTSLVSRCDCAARLARWNDDMMEMWEVGLPACLHSKQIN